MPEKLTLDASLPPELSGILHRTGELAAARGEALYLVGGMVRDLLLGLPNLDIDLVLEGDAVEMAKLLTGIYGARLTVHAHFGTARLGWRGWTIDLATARSETYARPGALPTVQPGDIHRDLFRRDFTINAMALYLSPSRYGELLDIYGGREDISARLIRVLHDRSFIDDATRIWRALRYEQRLDFTLEQQTGELLRRDIPMLGSISADRIRYEIECVLRENRPEKVFRRAGELSVLASVYPALSGNGWLADKFEAARQFSLPEPPPGELYLALLAYRLSESEAEELISRLKLSRLPARAVREAQALKEKIEVLGDVGTPPSAVYRALSGCSLPAVAAVMIASSAEVSRNIRLYLDRLRYVKTSLRGEDLKRLGVPPGREIGEVLELLRQARLDEALSSPEDEGNYVRSWLAERRGGAL